MNNAFYNTRSEHFLYSPAPNRTAQSAIVPMEIGELFQHFDEEDSVVGSWKQLLPERWAAITITLHSSGKRRILRSAKSELITGSSILPLVSSLLPLFAPQWAYTAFFRSRYSDN